jgi:hypothetical protein
MGQDTILYTIPQWIIFVGVISIAYGWVEKKRIFNLIGLGLFIGLGIFAVYAIASGCFAFSKFMSPNEIISEEMEEDVVQELPLQAKLLPAYWLFVVAGMLAIPSFFLELKKKRFARWFLVFMGLVAIGGFFIVIGAVRG